MRRSELENLITKLCKRYDLNAEFVQQTEGLSYVRFVVEEDECVGDQND
tara:strand:- start:144 stop:290 length:147 start_codon:yes stop_codon:yes gene_type:complete